MNKLGMPSETCDCFTKTHVSRQVFLAAAFFCQEVAASAGYLLLHRMPFLMQLAH